MLDKVVKDAILQENTDFFDAAFQMSDQLKRASHGNAGYSLLHYAASYSTERMVKYFLDKGFSVNSRTFYNQTALHVAVLYCRYGTVKLLIEEGTPVDARDTMGRTALHYAMKMGKVRHMFNAKWNNSCTKEFSARRFPPGVPPNASARLQKIFRCTETRSEAHFWSVDNRHIISHLLLHGADVNALSEEKDTPLFQAIAHGSESLVRLLMERGANVNHYQRGYNVLHHAAHTCDNRNVAELLLDTGIGVNSLTATGRRTALHLAAASARSVEIVNLLIERGAMVNAQNRKGETPIFLAIGPRFTGHHNDLGHYIEIPELDELQAVAHAVFPVNSTIPGCNEPQTLEERRYHIVRSLLDAGAEVNHSTRAGEPALHRAVTIGIESIIELFLERGADVHSKNRISGSTALHAAVKGDPINDNIEMMEEDTPLHLTVLRKETHIKMLLAKGADINATDRTGSTPLHCIGDTSLSQHAIQKLVGILLDNGANPFARTFYHKNPLDCAVRMQNNGMIKALLRHLAYLEAMGDRRALRVAMRSINNERTLMMIYEKYQNEVVSTKEEKIYSDVSYFDMITHDLTRWVRNDEFVEAFKNNQTIKMFYYYDKVSKKFNDALNKRMAIEYCVWLFSDEGLPIPICETIVKYFEPEDIEKFVRSCEETEC